MRVLALSLATILLLAGLFTLWLDHDLSGRGPMPFIGGQTDWQWAHLTIGFREWSWNIGSKTPGVLNIRLTWLGAVSTFGGFAGVSYVVGRRLRERRIRQRREGQGQKEAAPTNRGGFV